MYLTWIVFIRDGNEDVIHGMPENFINVRKRCVSRVKDRALSCIFLHYIRRKLAAVLQEIQQYQNTPYCIDPEPSIQKFLLSQDPQGDTTPLQWEESLFEQSRLIEPRDQPPMKAVCFSTCFSLHVFCVIVYFTDLLEALQYHLCYEHCILQS